MGGVLVEQPSSERLCWTTPPGKAGPVAQLSSGDAACLHQNFKTNVKFNIKLGAKMPDSARSHGWRIAITLIMYCQQPTLVMLQLAGPIEAVCWHLGGHAMALR